MFGIVYIYIRQVKLPERAGTREDSGVPWVKCSCSDPQWAGNRSGAGGETIKPICLVNQVR